MTNPGMQSDAVRAELVGLLGAANVISGHSDLEYYAMDAYSIRELPIAVALPGSVFELQAVVRLAASQGIAVVPRGGAAMILALTEVRVT